MKETSKNAQYLLTVQDIIKELNYHRLSRELASQDPPHGAVSPPPAQAHPPGDQHRPTAGPRLAEGNGKGASGILANGLLS